MTSPSWAAFACGIVRPPPRRPRKGGAASHCPDRRGTAPAPPPNRQTAVLRMQPSAPCALCTSIGRRFVENTAMKFRLKALGLHLSASACTLSLILGALYLGWYSWPGWALTDVTHVVVVMVGVDVVL